MFEQAFIERRVGLQIQREGAALAKSMPLNINLVLLPNYTIWVACSWFLTYLSRLGLVNRQICPATGKQGPPFLTNKKQDGFDQSKGWQRYFRNTFKASLLHKNFFFYNSFASNRLRCLLNQIKTILHIPVKLNQQEATRAVIVCGLRMYHERDNELWKHQ